MSLRDITFQNNVGFPINRVEKIGYIQKLLEQEKTELPPEEKTEAPAVDRHNFGKQTKEIACTAGRLQDIAL